MNHREETIPGRSGYVYVGKWECEFDREVPENDTLRNCVQQSEMINPLEPRDAFYGGRTEAFTLFQKRPGYIIRRCNLPVSIYQ